MQISSDYFVFINIACVLFLFISLIIGAKRGFLIQALHLAGMILAFFIVIVFLDQIADKIALFPKQWLDFGYEFINNMVYPYVNKLCWFLVIFIMFKVLILIISPLIKTIQKLPVLKEVNNLLGGLMGIINGLIWIMIFSVILRLPCFANGTDVIENTFMSLPSMVINTTLENVPIDVEKANDIKAFLDEITEQGHITIDEGLTDENLQKLKEMLSEKQYESLFESITNKEKE